MKRKINRESYLSYAKILNNMERQLIEEFAKWLPETIIDCHAHCNLSKHIRWIDDSDYNHMLSTFPSFNLGESKEWHEFFYPGRIVRMLRFPNTFRGINHKAANFYLLKQSQKQDKIALYGLPDDPDYTIGMMEHPRVSALKMYYSYLEPPATEIYQYFPKVVLEAAQRRNIPIILHLPRKITRCLGQLLKLMEDFPRLRICLAHLGLTKFVVLGLEDAFATIAQYPLVNFDTALVPSVEAISMALRVVGSDRIMYGSDEPLNLIRSIVYKHPQLGERLATEYLYHWVDPREHEECNPLLIKDITHAHWQSLRAIKDAITMLPEVVQEETKRKIFHDNAEKFYCF